MQSYVICWFSSSSQTWQWKRNLHLVQGFPGQACCFWHRRVSETSAWLETWQGLLELRCSFYKIFVEYIYIYNTYVYLKYLKSYIPNILLIPSQWDSCYPITIYHLMVGKPVVNPPLVLHHHEGVGAGPRRPARPYAARGELQALSAPRRRDPRELSLSLRISMDIWYLRLGYLSDIWNLWVSDILG